MSIPFDFTYQKAQHKATLEPTDSPTEKMVSIDGRNYKIMGGEEDVFLLRHHIESLKSVDFETFGSFKASLVGISPYEKVDSIFQNSLISSSETTVIEGGHNLVDIRSLKEEIEKDLPPSAGAMVVVYEKGKLLPPICVGQTSVTGETAQSVNMKTSALIGSGAKMFTALLAQVLCEKGILSLKTKLSDVLTEEQFKIFKDPDSAKQVTLEMLLSHTSGLQYFADDNQDSRKGQNLDQILEGMRPEGIRFIASHEDGVYSYSNQIELAAVFIEKAYKEKSESDLDEIPITYSDIMKRELLDPLGMERTTFEKPRDTNVLRAYGKEGSFDVEILDPLMRGAGGLWSCMEDMTKLVEAYGEEGLKTSSGKILISKEGLQGLTKVRGVNGNTGLGLNVEGSVVGKGGSFASYGFTLKMDPSKGNAVISMCNFTYNEANFDSFSHSVNGVLNKMYPDKEDSTVTSLELTQKDSHLFPMDKCDLFFKGDRGYVGFKRTEIDPGIILNWNGQTLPVRKLVGDRYLILDEGYPGGQIFQIVKGKQTGKLYAIIEKVGETNAFQEVPKDEMFFPKDMNFLKDIAEAQGTYKSIKGAPPFKFDIFDVDDLPNCRLSLGKFPPVTALITEFKQDKKGNTTEVFLQANCGPYPPDKLFKISRGDVVREETLKELAEKELEFEKLKKQGAHEKAEPLEKQIYDLQKLFSSQKDVSWFFRVADFMNPDNNYEAIPLTK